MRRVCVFCGSSAGARPDYAEAAAEVGRLLATRGLGLVYGGSNIGLMGILANAALAGGGEVIGVIPEALVAREIAHRGLSELRVVPSMHTRKALMADLSDAFLVLPGGYGTFDEFCEVLTWAQLGIHDKPCGVLNTCGYFDALLAAFDHAVEECFVRPQNRGLVLSGSDPGQLIEKLLVSCPGDSRHNSPLPPVAAR